MKPRIRIDMLNVGDVVTSTFLIAKHVMKQSRDGVDYLSLSLVDRTGTLDARVWTDAKVLADRCKVDDFVAVRGEVETYGERLSMTIHDLEPIDSSDVDLREFFAHSRWNADDLFQQLLDLIDAEVHSPPLLAFFEAIFSDENLVERFKAAPAAMRNHHAYRAGLIEHCLSMSRVAALVGRHYDAYYPGMIQIELLVAGCILHDIGKCDELDFHRTTRYSTAGRLVGHIPMGSDWVTKYAAKSAVPVPEDLVLELKHLVLSHHGKHEYGSPVLPQTAEAHLLHFIDMMDSRMNAFGSLQPSGAHREYWTDFQRSLEAPLYFRGDVSWGAPERFAEADLVGPGLVTVSGQKGPK